MNRFKYGNCVFGSVNQNLHDFLCIGGDKKNIQLKVYVEKLRELIQADYADVYYGDDTFNQSNSSPLGIFKFTFHGEPYHQN